MLHLSKRHQFWQCWVLTSLDILHQRSFTEGERQVLFRSLPFDIQEGIALKSEVEDIPKEEKVGVVSSLLTNNIKYKVGDTIIIDVVEEDISIFMKLEKYRTVQGSGLSLEKLLTPKTFNCHYHAFSLENQNKWGVVHPGDIQCNKIMEGIQTKSTDKNKAQS